MAGSEWRVTASNQEVPEISVGKTLLRGRQIESRTVRVCGPVEKDRRTECQGVVPTVISLTASGKPPGWVSLTRKQGPESEVMSCERTKAWSV